MGYSYRLAARVLLYAPSHGLCYTSRGALAGTRNSSMGPLKNTEQIKENKMNEGRKEGSVLFNDALNTFYLRLYGVRHMVKDHSDSEKGNLMPPHRLLFPITAMVILHAPFHRQDSTYHGLCYTSRGALAGMRNSSMGPPHEGSIQRPIAQSANALTTELHLAPPNGN